jgi:hypothetical protein
LQDNQVLVVTGETLAAQQAKENENSLEEHLRQSPCKIFILSFLLSFLASLFLFD